MKDLHTLEDELKRFERKYNLRSETFYAAYSSGEEPEGDAWNAEREDWHRLSAVGLECAYGEDEPEYTEEMIKERNPDYRWG